jgi:putative glutamine amidotransferase
VKDVAPGFVISATAPDGIIEAIERAGQGFCLGVQWHPENYWRTGEFSRLFEGLVEAATEHRHARSV